MQRRLGDVGVGGELLEIDPSTARTVTKLVTEVPVHDSLVQVFGHGPEATCSEGWLAILLVAR